ncbi:MAG: hypothetical protein HYY84_12585 [Deltaproteobacteria bacterium]|nr:hypothetical protein [Deltaproteobacteria bacterium]
MITQRPPVDEIDPNELELEIDETDLVSDENDAPALRAHDPNSAGERLLALDGASAPNQTDDTSFVEVVEITDADVVATDPIAVASFDKTASVEEELTADDLLADEGGGDIDWSNARRAAEPLNVWWKGLAPEIAFSLDDDDDEPLLVEIEQGELSAFRRSTGGASLSSGGETVPPPRRDLIWSSDSAPTDDVKNVLSGAESLLEKGRHEDAAMQVAIASRLSPLDLELQERAKNLYLKLGMPASAVERLIHLAILAFESGARARALSYAEEALALSPDNRGVMRLVERLV